MPTIKSALNVCLRASIAVLSGLILLTTLSFEANAAKTLIKTPEQIIAQLRLRIISIGKTTASPTDFDIAIHAALDDLSTFIKVGDDLAALNRKDAWGKTPLNYAAYMGFGEIVGALLDQPSIRISIDEPDDVGITPWTYALFAVNQSAFACNPKLFNSPFSWSSLYASRPYYVQRSPYVDVRKRLEEAGAATDLDKAKQQWHTICSGQSAATKDSVESSTNLQMTVIHEGDKALQTFLDKLQHH